MIAASFTAYDDDEDPLVETSPLAGTWTALSYTDDSDVASTSVMTNNTVTTVTDIDAADLDYRLTFTDDEWSTEGSYTMMVEFGNENNPPFRSTDDYANVSRMNSYELDGDQLTIDGSFFEISIGGVGYAGDDGLQTYTYTINGDVLELRQDYQFTTEIPGIDNSITSVRTLSTWRRQ